MVHSIPSIDVSSTCFGTWNRPFYRYGGHFDFYCFEKHYVMLRGQIHINLPPGHPIMFFETIEIKMAAVSAKRSMCGEFCVVFNVEVTLICRVIISNATILDKSRQVAKGSPCLFMYMSF